MFIYKYIQERNFMHHRAFKLTVNIASKLQRCFNVLFLTFQFSRQFNFYHVLFIP